MSGPILRTESLTIGYGGTAVARDVVLDCGQGEVVALLGPNGGGKTTLLKTMLGLQPSLSGRVLLGDDDVAGWTPRECARVFGYVPQSSPGFFPFTAREIVLMGRTARIGTFSAPSAADRQMVEQVMEDLGIARLAEREYTRISGGERQLVLIARALAQEPRFLILDEPTASLDFGNQIMVLKTLGDLGRSGLGIVFSTHHPEQALAHADRSVLLAGGGVVAAGPTGEILTDDSLSALYGLPVRVARVDGRAVCVPA